MIHRPVKTDIHVGVTDVRQNRPTKNTILTVIGYYSSSGSQCERSNGMTRHMVLIPCAGEPTLVEADTLDGMREHIGADYIERVRVDRYWSLAVDEDGRRKNLPLNPTASVLYGTEGHGVPIVGDVLLAREGFSADGIDWLDTSLEEAIVFVSSRVE